jgi:hypothetical protein
MQELREWLEHLDRSEGASMPDARTGSGIGIQSPSSWPMEAPTAWSPDFQSITLLRILQRPRVIALPVTVAALISIFACMLLSRYLTLPLERLRRAAQAYRGE